MSFSWHLLNNPKMSRKLKKSKRKGGKLFSPVFRIMRGKYGRYRFGSFKLKRTGRWRGWGFSWIDFLSSRFGDRVVLVMLRFTYRNCWVTLVRGSGEVIGVFSCGRVVMGRGRHGERKVVSSSSRVSLAVMAELGHLCARKLSLVGVESVYVVLRCFPTFLVEVFLHGLVDGGAGIFSIFGVFFWMPIAHNGCKVFNRRRI